MKKDTASGSKEANRDRRKSLVIARSEATKQSRLSPRRDSGLLRFARNDGANDDISSGGPPVTAQTIIQSLASGLLMGLLYGLIAVGLALIFGLMDVVNFAHGEFLMIAMYVTFFLFAFFALDPLLSAPFVAAAVFVFGPVVYRLIVRFAVRPKAMPAWCRFSPPLVWPS